MRECSKCLYFEDHPLGLTFTDEGVCSGCMIHQEKDELDWGARESELRAILKPYRAASGRAYDCVVPVSGAGDSHFIVHIVKSVLGMNPLLVSYNKFYNSSVGIKNLANLKTTFDCDLLLQNVNPQSVKKVTRSTLRRFGSIYWHCLAGQSVYPVQTSVRMKIPLIIWGAHQGLEQVGMFSHLHNVEMTRRYRRDHDLFGQEAEDLLVSGDTLDESNLFSYFYPTDQELSTIGVRGIYLGNFFRWDPKAQHEQMVKQYGYQPAASIRSFDTYDYVDCLEYLSLHDILKIRKHGYSKITDHACREIRHGRLSKTEALYLVKLYERNPRVGPGLFEQWLGIDRNSLKYVINSHTNSKYWKNHRPDMWDFAGWSQRSGSKYFSDHKPTVPVEGFQSHNSINVPRNNAYITYGKGITI